MKALSVLFTVVLLFAADRLAAHIKRAHQPPVNTAQPAPTAPDSRIITAANIPTAPYRS